MYILLWSALCSAYTVNIKNNSTTDPPAGGTAEYVESIAETETTRKLDLGHDSRQ